MNILHLCPYSINALRTGGPAMQLNRLVKAEQFLGHRATIITTTGNLDDNIQLTINGKYEFFEEDSIPTFYFQRKNYIFPPTYYYAPDLPAFLRTHVHDYDIVCIHEIWTYLNWVGSKICNELGIPYIIFCHGSFEPWAWRYHGLKKKIYWELFEKRIFDYSSGIIALNNEEEKQIKNLGVRRPIFQIKNGILLPIQFVKEPEQILKINIPELNGHPYILFIGRLHPKKGLEILLEAWKQVSDIFPDYKIVIAGPDEGQYLRRLLSLRKKYHIEDTVIFPGLVTGEIKQALLQKASIFLLTSFSEGMPGAVIEAMAYGLPVIITLGCHLPIIDQAKAGMIVRPNIHEVIKAVRFLLENAEARQQMGINAKNLVKTEFDEHKIAQDFINFCESVINKNKKN